MKRLTVGLSSNRAFTLLEILLAIVIIGTVLSTVFASYKSTLRTMKTVETQLEIYEMGRMTLERMIKDLESVRMAKEAFDEPDIDNPPPWYVFEGDENSIHGEHADSMWFTSDAHIGFGPENISVIAMIGYCVYEEKESSTLDLRRIDYFVIEKERGSNKSCDTAEPEGFSLCKGLASVNFQYLNSEGDMEETWSLQVDKAMPEIVKITLEFVDPENSGNRYIFTTAVRISHYEPPDVDD